MNESWKIVNEIGEITVFAQQGTQILSQYELNTYYKCEK